ncbi:MAG: xylulokinase [bacterium]|nr:xylulokinase [bacterium]
MKRYLLGIDLGTSSVKAAIVDEDGQMQGLGQVGYDIEISRPDWAEQDPGLWWRAASQAVCMAVSQAGHSCARDIAGIGLSGQMHGLVVLDDAFRLLRPAIIWADQRSTAEVEAYYRIIGRDRLAAITANPVATGFFGPSLMWVKKHEPSLYQRIRWCLLPKDYVRYRLTGQIGTEITDASSTLLFDTARQTWSHELCAALGLESYYLPPCSVPWKVAGELTLEAATALDLQPGIPVAFGGADQPMHALGNEICAPGTVSVTIGSAGQVFTPITEVVYDPQLRAHTFCHALPDTWYVMGGTLSAGLSLKWFSQHIADCRGYEDLSRAASQVPPGSDGLLFLPYLLGERTPYMDPKARGAFLGLSLRHTNAHLANAVMEGVVFSLSEVVDILHELALPVNQVIASGGGAYSAHWLQIIANVLNCPVSITNSTEQACLGAALTAGIAVGLYADPVEACRTAVPTPVLMAEPNPDHVTRYQAVKPIYTRAYSVNKTLFHALSAQAK